MSETIVEIEVTGFIRYATSNKNLAKNILSLSDSGEIIINDKEAHRQLVNRNRNTIEGCVPGKVKCTVDGVDINDASDSRDNMFRSAFKGSNRSRNASLIISELNKSLL